MRGFVRFIQRRSIFSQDAGASVRGGPVHAGRAAQGVGNSRAGRGRQLLALFVQGSIVGSGDRKSPQKAQTRSAVVEAIRKYGDFDVQAQ